MLINVEQLESAARRYAGNFKDEKSNASAEEAFVTNVPPKIVKDNILRTQENLANRKKMLSTLRQEPTEFAYERAIGKNDSVYSNFVELIRNAKRKVGRIAIKEGIKDVGYATGFLVGENLMLTNWHVFKRIEEVGESEIQFNYELNSRGEPTSSVSFKLQSDIFYYANQELDYCFVAVNPVDTSGKIKLKDTSYLFLDPKLGKIGSETEELLNIIHHPDGDYMQLSIRENLFVKITPTTVWYKSDTAPGSSGSPVFNDQWQVVALHHSGVAKQNANGDYLDKDGKVIPLINGKIEGSKIVWVANEGMRISVILNDVMTKFPDKKIIQGLQVKPEIIQQFESLQVEKNSENKPNNIEMETNNITVSFPASVLEKNPNVKFTISQDPAVSPVSKKKTDYAVVSTIEEVNAEEIKRLEETMDLSDCKGYQARFLGTDNKIDMPEPMKDIKKFIAKIGTTDSVVLKYYNYSTFFNSVRMMPALSAINVDGDPKKRKDDSERKDTWLRDNRISLDIQLSDEYYKKSGFDRGHMSRREDANWGSTAAEAKRNADYTCMYTNACPQVAKINQSSRKGLWGILEKVVLEAGAETEDGSTAKISVFNGPIFKDSDPVYKAIQVPLDFFKIVVWLTDDHKLRATAFKLTQTNIVDDIDFEQLDLDQNTEFKEYQCSIKWLQTKTKIDFSQLIPIDTFEGNSAADEIAIESENHLYEHVRRHSHANEEVSAK